MFFLDGQNNQDDCVCVCLALGYSNFLCAHMMQGAKPWLNGWQYAELLVCIGPTLGDNLGTLVATESVGPTNFLCFFSLLCFNVLNHAGLVYCHLPHPLTIMHSAYQDR